MKRLFDASALVNLALDGGSKAVDVIAEGSALVLTFYEMGNSVWKLSHLLKKLSSEESKSLLGVLLQLFDQLSILNLGTSDAMQIEELATLHRITFYDSAYLYAAKKNKLVLVTDDGQLARAAGREKIEAVSSSSILSQISRHSQ